MQRNSIEQGSEPDCKHPAKSKLLWFNGAMMFLFAMLEQTTPALKAVLPPDIYGWLLVASSAGNFALRFYTDKPIR
jgi:hypothetical protein